MAFHPNTKAIANGQNVTWSDSDGIEQQGRVMFTDGKRAKVAYEDENGEAVAIVVITKLTVA